LNCLILACDGLWDVVTNETAVKFVGRRLTEGIPVAKIAHQLVDYALDKRSFDNVSVLIVVFEHCSAKG